MGEHIQAIGRKASPLASGGEQSAGSLVRAVAILRVIAGRGRAGLSLADVARDAALPRPTVHRVCQMLEELGWIERDASGKRLFLGAELAVLGLSAQLRHSVDALARPILSELSKETGQTFYLTVRSGADSVCLARCESEALIRTLVLEVGSRQPLGVGAGSMAILAALPDEEVERVIGSNRERYRERVVFHEKTFREYLSLARDRGFAGHEGLFTRGVSGIGVAVKDRSGYPIAAVSTAFITDWLDADQQRLCAERMKAAAEQIANRMTGSGVK